MEDPKIHLFTLILDHTICSNQRGNLTSGVCSIDLATPGNFVVFDYLNLINKIKHDFLFQ